MFPLNDINPHDRPPIITYLILVTNILVWVFFQGLGDSDSLSQSICEWGFVPRALTGGGDTSPLCSQFPIVPTFSIFSSMFLHGGWFHLIGNMWFLHVFGNNIEDRLGHFKYFLFYVLSGVGAAGLQFMFDTTSPIPMVGASGAISGIMGAYLMIFPRVKIRSFIFFGFFYRVLLIPAYVMLGYWFLLQLFGGALTNSQMGGVAYWAHVGGFVVGAVVGYFARR